MANDPEVLADALERRLRERAEAFGWSPSSNPQLLLDRDSQGVESLLTALRTPALELTSDSLPTSRRALDLLPSSLSLLISGITSSDPDGSYRAALWWAGLIRTQIEPSKRSDLHLFLIAPAGTASEPDWQRRRGQIEGDERFCRKFVWLPSTDPTGPEILAFLDRTFLAQPWEGQSAEPRPLDPLEGITGEMPSNSLLSKDEARRWISRLGTLDATAIQQLAEDLVAILETP